jgi:signal transduction histidine kinase
MKSPAPWGTRARWLIGVSAAAVLGVNAAGLWAISVARRTAREETVRQFRVETAAHARRVESGLLGTRADLAFLAGSSAVARLERLGLGARASDDAGQQPAVEAVVVFLRAHPEVAHLNLLTGDGNALVRTGRRGGLPVLWSASDALAAAGAGPMAPGAGGEYVRAELAFAGSGPAAVRLVAEIDASALIAQAVGGGAQAPACALRDATGRSLSPWAAHAASPGALAAEAPVHADGWSSPSPWTLACTSEAPAEAALAPVARRYRMTLALNLGVMVLAALLGSFAIQQTRRRERLEAEARDERRIRDLERQLFHAERLATVGRLAAGMAHEINNPLEGMSNYLSLARDELRRGETEKAAHRLDGVREGMERIAAIVRQSLAHADPATAPATPVDAGALVRETVDFIRTRRELAAIRVTTHVPDRPLVVQGNAVTLGQVLLNIVLNACEAQPDGGEVEITGTADTDAVVLEIADRGPGVAPADLTRIFDPFFSTKQSTGLGLSICHAIVARHRGALTAENRAGGGARFRIRLPTD